jgi:hypothetical protein
MSHRDRPHDPQGLREFTVEPREPGTQHRLTETFSMHGCPGQVDRPPGYSSSFKAA